MCFALLIRYELDTQPQMYPLITRELFERSRAVLSAPEWMNRGQREATLRPVANEYHSFNTPRTRVIPLPPDTIRKTRAFPSRFFRSSPPRNFVCH